MKLLRITSNDPKGRFETDFKTDINISEKSKIALRNISFVVNKPQFIINSTNRRITFSIAGSDLVLDLSDNSYDKNNFNDLIKEIQDGFNNLLQHQGKQIGLQFGTKLTSGFFEIKYLSSPFNFQPDLFENKGAVSTTTSPVTLKAGDNTNLNNDSRMFIGKIPFIKGCGVIRMALSTFSDAGINGGNGDNNHGVFIGLTRQKRADLDNPTLTDLQKDLFIKIDKTSANGGRYGYGYIDSNGATQFQLTAHQPNIGDIIEIRRDLGQLRLGFYDMAGARTYNNLFNYNDTGDTLFLPYIIFRNGSDNLVLSNPRMQLNPEFFPPTLTLNSSIDSSEHPDYVFSMDGDDELGAVPRPQPQLRVNNILSFQGRSLSEFLGFDNILGLTRTELTDEANFKAENLFELTIYNDTHLLVIDNMDLESYDEFDGGRRNILEVIPVSDDNVNSVIQYEPNSLNFIDLKNIQKQNIRNIRGRILKADLSPVNLEGLTSITLLIDG
tara:strand:- start:315 stop:1805 length:1491 start_codon:yes stop_codon:yes gene_type:complete